MMIDMGLIGVIVVAVIAVLLLVFLVRRKRGGPSPAQSPLVASLAQEIAPTVTPPPPVAPAEPEIAEPAFATPEAAEPEVAATAAPVAPPAVSADGDDLRRLKGVGPKIVAVLHGEGITRFAQIAAWTDADLAAINAKLGSFAGRPQRDNWVEQARLLAAGDVAGYEAKFGKL